MTLRAIGLDTFAGLFNVGVERAGFTVIAQVEQTDYGAKTFKFNHGHVPIHLLKRPPTEWPLPSRVDLLFSAPPCAAWSNMKLKTRMGWKDETARLDYVREGVRYAMRLQPKAWVWESVVNAWRHGREFVLEQAELLNGAGFNVTVLLQDNQYLGVPQARQRMFMVAHKHPLVWQSFVEPITVADALRGVAADRKQMRAKVMYQPKPPALNESYTHLWGESLHTKGRLREAMNAIEGWTGSRPLNTVKRLDFNQPAPVMLASFMRLHPTEPRMLDWAEWLRLCGLPPSWLSAERSFDAATRELARAVMPPAGEWLARSIAAGFGLAKPRKITSRVVDLRKPTSPTEELLWQR